VVANRVSAIRDVILRVGEKDGLTSLDAHLNDDEAVVKMGHPVSVAALPHLAM